MSMLIPRVLASGLSPFVRVLEKGITVSLGTAILHRGLNMDPTLLLAEQALEMARYVELKPCHGRAK